MKTKKQYQLSYIKKKKEILYKEALRRTRKKYGKKKKFLSTDRGRQLLEEELKNDKIYQSYLDGSWVENHALFEEFNQSYSEYAALAEKQEPYLNEIKRKTDLVRSLELAPYIAKVSGRLSVRICNEAKRRLAAEMFKIDFNGDFRTYVPGKRMDDSMIQAQAAISLYRLYSVFKNSKKRSLVIRSFYGRFLKIDTKRNHGLSDLIAQKIISRYPTVRRRLDIENEVKGHFAGKTVFVPPFETILADEVARIFDEEVFIKGIAAELPLTHVERILQSNPYYMPAFQRREKQKRLNKEILSVTKGETEQSIADAYPEARSIRRHFILHIGPTNSGKTYSAVHRMAEGSHGIYLAPLRLLAFEQYENLKPYGCSLITGEERVIDDHVRFQSSTIEMLDIRKYYDICVIDEAQMLGDRARGCHWAKAILGVYCPEVHVCMAPEAESLVTKLIGLCGDTFETVRHERKTMLKFEEAQFVFPKDVKPGDALIVFSRRSAHAVASQLVQKGIRTSLIYGALPYDVRHEEAAKFADGTNPVIVATDAIGMGMNLPIRRIVFLEEKKFDGESRRLLNTSEIKQIAGRAGRYQKYDVGYVAAVLSGKYIRTQLDKPVDTIKEVILPFPESLLAVKEEVPLSAIMESWMKIPTAKGFRKVNLDSRILLCRFAEKNGADRSLAYELSGITVNTDDYSHLAIWQEIAKCIIDHRDPDLEKEIENFSARDADSLEVLENKYKVLDILYGFAVRYDEKNVQKCIETRKEISMLIMHALAHQKYNPKKCSCCGRTLPYNHPYSMCDSCYERRYGNGGWYPEWW